MARVRISMDNYISHQHIAIESFRPMEYDGSVNEYETTRGKTSLLDAIPIYKQVMTRQVTIKNIFILVEKRHPFAQIIRNIK